MTSPPTYITSLSSRAHLSPRRRGLALLLSALSLSLVGEIGGVSTVGFLKPRSLEASPLKEEAKESTAGELSLVGEHSAEQHSAEQHSAEKPSAEKHSAEKHSAGKLTAERRKESALELVEIKGARLAPVALRERAHEHLNADEVRASLARSTPEALQGVAGVYVQQTAHGQASAFIRGRTGRHTLLMVDGFRLNHALFRQGPNQYLFTIDPLSVASIDVLRGGGSVWLGANALSGAVLVEGRRPERAPHAHRPLKLTLTSQLSTADEGLVGRAEAEWRPHERFGVYVAGGAVERGELKAGGPLTLRADTPEVARLEKNVPRFRSDDQTQMGTGFSALSGDVVARYQGPQLDLTSALRLYRQYNAPRTDQCPPPEAPETWCLTYDEQFRTHAYTRLALKLKARLLNELKAGVSFQRQHERRTQDREAYLNAGRDAVNVWEGRAEGQSAYLKGAGGLGKLSFGLDGTNEQVSSKAWDTLVRSNVTRERSRGQYLDGSQYLRGGAWTGLRWRWLTEGAGEWRSRLGARLSASHALSPADELTETRAVDRGWRGATYGGGLAWSPQDELTLSLNIEQGFAAPNLDDLTARQLTGQGFQVENPNLSPERSLTYELGALLKTRGVTFEGWLFAMELTDGIERRDAECPQSDLACRASRTSRPFTLINLSEPAWIIGAEQRLGVELPWGLSIREHLSYARGEGPSPLAYERGQTRPLSRVPPLNGAASLRWSPREGLYLAYEARWALAATRLSFGDEIDTRIPFGGTPGYLVHRALFGGTFTLQGHELELLGALENLTNEAYRVHGSSVNGAARSLTLSLRYTPSL